MREPSAVDNRVLALIADENESTDLRMIMISLLGDFMCTSDIPLLVDTANSVDGDLAYNSIKALERIDADTAVNIATTIYKNYANEPVQLTILASLMTAIPKDTTGQPALYFQFLNVTQCLRQHFL